MLLWLSCCSCCCCVVVLVVVFVVAVCVVLLLLLSLQDDVLYVDACRQLLSLLAVVVSLVWRDCVSCLYGRNDAHPFDHH